LLATTGTFSVGALPGETLEGVRRESLHASFHDGLQQSLSRRLLQATSSSCNAKVDLVIVFDSTGSIGSLNYHEMKSWASTFVAGLNVGPDAFRVAMLVYGLPSVYSSGNTYWYYDFNEYTTAAQASAATAVVPYMSAGGTFTGDAVALAHAGLLDTSKGARPSGSGVSKLMMIITDGFSYDDTATPALAARNDGIDIFSVGVGYGYDTTQLVGMASSPSSTYVLQLTGFDSLSTITSYLTTQACSQAAPVDPDTNVEGTCNEGDTNYYSYSASLAS
jgi:hypothetical protein